MMGLLYTLAVFAVLLGVLVFVHEFGHYLAAKAFGIWVHRFSVGMGKPIKWLSFHRGETEWAVSWLPLGGYVRMASREEDPATNTLEGGAVAEVPPDRVFEAKPVWQRMVVILAGVTLNALLAWVIFTGLAWTNGRQFDPTTSIGAVNSAILPPEAGAVAGIAPGTRVTTVDGEKVDSWGAITSRIVSGRSNQIVFGFADGNSLSIPMDRDALVERSRVAEALQPMYPAVVGTISVGSPAEQAGLQPGDSIASVNDLPIQQWTSLTGLIRNSPGLPLVMKVIRGNQPMTLTVTPREEREVVGDDNSPLIGRVGISAEIPWESVPLSLGEAFAEGTRASGAAATSIYRTLAGLARGKVSHKEVGGPILIGQMAGQAARAGLSSFLALMALISMNLAIVNLLPIPVLDGGAFVLLLIEGIIRRPLPSKAREIVSMAGLAIIVLLMIVVFQNDISRLLGK